MVAKMRHICVPCDFLGRDNDGDGDESNGVWCGGAVH